MNKAAKSLIKNFLELLKKNKFIQNGTRGYYSRRTQPPFFCLMLKALYKYSPKFHNLVLTKGLSATKKEFNSFEKKRTIDVNVSGIKYKMFMYKVLRNFPRVESTKKDFENCFNSTPEARKNIYMKFKTAAESGIDFTSRFYKIPNDRKTIDILNRIPVDLNALMYNIALFISKMFKKLGDFEKSKLYKDKAKSIKKASTIFFGSQRNVCGVI
ncbi:hypothetical protein H311_03621 [Anncaliia algerae PRA109]|nr:hypothetical protein H311_03621 [Anncaliia algerae PRA109]